jgi:hypothetical protein
MLFKPSLAGGGTLLGVEKKTEVLCANSRYLVSPGIVRFHRLLPVSGVFGLLIVLVSNGAARAQTACAEQYTSSGAFICYPQVAGNGEDLALPSLFHLSAQGNAVPGRAIIGYRVLIDNRLVYQNKFPVPLQNLSIETNLNAPFPPGPHTLQLLISGAGSVVIKGLHFDPSKNASFCDLFGSGPGTCGVSNNRSMLHWSPAESLPSKADAFSGYSAYLNLFSRNFKSIETDSSDAVAVDAQGNVIAVSHALANVDIRKYAANGSLIFSSLIRSCGDGFLSVAGLAVDKSGRAWIAGNTTACLPATPGALVPRVSATNGTRGFVMLVDTTKPGATAPLYLTYLSDMDNQIASIRVDGEGNAYVAGTTSSLQFPHQASLRLDASAEALRGATNGFVSVVNPSGSRLLWSTILPNAKLTALALDGKNNIYVTGRLMRERSPSRSRRSCAAGGKAAAECTDALVAELSDRGSRLSYVAMLGGSAGEEGRAISFSKQSGWTFVTGETDSSDFPVISAANEPHLPRPRRFLVVLQPCRGGVLYSRRLAELAGSPAPEIAFTPALDAFTAALPKVITVSEIVKPGLRPFISVPVAPTCSSATP